MSDPYRNFRSPGADHAMLWGILMVLVLVAIGSVFYANSPAGQSTASRPSATAGSETMGSSTPGGASGSGTIGSLGGGAAGGR